MYQLYVELWSTSCSGMVHMDPMVGSGDPMDGSGGPHHLSICMDPGWSTHPLALCMALRYSCIVCPLDIMHRVWCLPLHWHPASRRSHAGRYCGCGLRVCRPLAPRDCVPGRANTTTLAHTSPGIMYGQCSEICGALHGYMPLAMA